jgi:opacity protein-like surface antigen
MCELATAIAIVSAVASAAATNSAARAQNKAIEEGYAQQMETVQEQYKQIDAQAAQQMSERGLEAMKERARLRVIAGESGALGGVSNERIMNESKFNEGTDIATIEANRSNNLKQTHLEAKGIRAGSVKQLSQVKQPSLIGTGLQIAGIYADEKAKKDKLNAPKR